MVLGKSWMDQSDYSIQIVCKLTELKQVRGGGKHPVEFKPYCGILLLESLCTHCRE